MCVLSHFSHIQLFATPWTVAHRVPLSMGISRQEYWSGLPCPSSGCLPNLGIESMSLKSPTLVGRFFTTSATWEVLLCHQFSSVQLLSCIWLFATPWITAHQASLSITNSQSLPKLMPIKSVMPSSHLIFCRPLLPPSFFPSIRDFSRVNSLHEVAKVLEFQFQH